MKTAVASRRLVRRPAHAGGFYPSDPVVLRQTVEGLLAQAAAEPAPALALIAPHAGYEFSGRCAAETFARVMIPRTVVLLGPNHYGAAHQPQCAGTWRDGAFATPLGEVPVDAAFTAALLEHGWLVAHDRLAHREEHALEVELPFVQLRAAGAPVAIVPLVLSWEDWPRSEALATIIAAVIQHRDQDGVLLVASSDMSHFEPACVALQRDADALGAIRQLDGEELLRVARARGNTMCGAAAVAVVLESARRLGASRVEVVAHTHSGLATGDYSSVVSYAGVVIR